MQANITEHFGAPPIVHGPNIGKFASRELQNAGYTVVRTLDELEAAVRARRVGP